MKFWRRSRGANAATESNMDLPILYEDSDVVVVNKPAGLVVHSDGRTKEPAVTDWVLEHYPEAREVGETLKLTSGEIIPRPGIVHRLDRETSGVLLIAKNQDAFLFLKKQFQGRQTKKVYNTFVYGKVKADQGIIDRPIARSKNDFRKWTAMRGRQGRERGAVTEYKTLSRFAEGGEGFSFLEVNPKTGRTHQIRVHLKSINHPVVCDKLYAPKRECALGFGRTALHARSLEFTAQSGKRITVEAPHPDDFKEAIKLSQSGVKIGREY